MFHLHPVKDEAKITVLWEQKNTQAFFFFETYLPTRG